MALPAATLDHVVINTRDDMDRAADVYRRLGFTLTERGYHSLGSMNHLAMFGTDYLELIAIPKGATSGRLDLLDYAFGLNGLGVGTEDWPRPMPLSTGRACRSIHRSNDAPLKVDGHPRSRFCTVRMKAGIVPYGRVYYCHHFTRDLVWRASGANMITARLPWRGPASSSQIPGKRAELYADCPERRRCARSRVAEP